MNGYWKTSIHNGYEYNYFKNLLRMEWRDINTKVSPYVEVFSDNKGGHIAYCPKKVSFSDWHYVTAKLINYRHKKKVEHPLFSYIWKQINRINTMKKYCIEKYPDIPEEILKYLDHDKEALLELQNNYYKKENWETYENVRDAYGLPDLCGIFLESDKKEEV